MNKEIDRKWMGRALELAQKARGKTSPNPMVGAVAVKNGRAVGEGYHRKAGGKHAEVLALAKSGRQAKDCDLYITLEPCCHFGKTPPCVDLIISSSVKRVVIGAKDPNPLVSGKGIHRLKSAGIEVVTGVLNRQCRELNKIFFKYIRTGMPFATLKAGMSMDGKIATAKGESKWITGAPARRIVHQMRSETDAILVGAGTVVKDNPQLTARLKNGKTLYPTRVVLDNKASVPLNSKVFHRAREEKVIYFSGLETAVLRERKLKAKGVEVVKLKERKGTLPIRAVMKELAEREITSVLIEGGGEIHASALKEKVVDKIVFFFAPKIIGGRNAPGVVGGEGIARLQDALELQDIDMTNVGNDWMLEASIK